MKNEKNKFKVSSLKFKVLSPTLNSKLQTRNYLPMCLIALLCSISFAKAQSITPFVINSTGGSFSNNGFELSFNMGEVAISTIGSGSKLITQGFLQTEKGTVTGIASHTKNPYKIVAYPNPAKEFLLIETTHPDVIRMTLTDFAGKVISSTPFAEKTELGT